MLTRFRENIAGPVAWIFLGLIAASFAIVGVGFNFNFIGNTNIAEANDEEIGLGYFESRYRDVLSENPQLMNVTDEQRVRIRRQLLDNIIREALIDEYLSDLGYRITDEAVIESIREVPQFQVDGEFNMELYRSLVGQQGYTTTQFERAQRRLIREQQMQLAIAASALVSPAEYRRYINVVAETRVVTAATLSPETVSSGIEISEEDVVTFYDFNTTLFQQPESADIEYVLISRGDIAAGIEVTEDDLLEYYELEKDRYLQPEQRQARHILVLFGDDEAAAEASAEGYLARVQAGEPFEDIARQYSMDGGTASNGGDLGASTREQLPGELGSAIFSMEPGEVRGLVRTEFGFHIVRLDEVLEPGPLPFEQVRSDLLAEMQDDEADNAFLAVERAMSNALFDTPEMGAIAAAAGVELGTLESFTRSGGGELGANQAAIDAVFDPRVLNDGEISDVIELDADSSAVFRVIQYNEATRQPMDEVRPQIEASLRAQIINERLAANAQAVVDRVRNLGDFGEAAAAVGGTVGEPILLDRDNRDVDAMLVASAFRAAKPEQGQPPVVEAVRNLSGGYTVFTVDAVLPGRPESIPVEDRDLRKLQLAQQSGFGDYNAFVAALVENADIVINEEFLAGNEFVQ